MPNIFVFDDNFDLQVFALNFGGYLQLLMSLSFLKIPFFVLILGDFCSHLFVVPQKVL